MHNPHKAIQYIALYDILIKLVSPKGKKAEQKYVSQFLGKNKERYKFAKFVLNNKDSNQKEDMLTHIRNNIAHSQNAGIDQFLKTTESITGKEVAYLLQIINDILSENVKVS